MHFKHSKLCILHFRLLFREKTTAWAINIYIYIYAVRFSVIFTQILKSTLKRDSRKYSFYDRNLKFIDT